MVAETNNAPPHAANGFLAWRGRVLAQHPWVAFVVPLVIYSIFIAWEPAAKPEANAERAVQAAVESPAVANGNIAAGAMAPDVVAAQPDVTAQRVAAPSWFAGLAHPGYALIYAMKLAATLAAMAFVWPVYRGFAPRGLGLGVVAGAFGVVAWIGLCHLQIEQRWLVPLLTPLGLSGWITGASRPGFNPFAAWPGQPLLWTGFLALRFLGLAAVVPIIEEFFYRGFLMRWIDRADWTAMPEGEVTWRGALAAVIVPMLMHPTELLAAAVWFSLIVALFARTRSIWSCVAAHATTNALLGIYIVTTGAWHLW